MAKSCIIPKRYRGLYSLRGARVNGVAVHVFVSAKSMTLTVGNGTYAGASCVTAARKLNIGRRRVGKQISAAVQNRPDVFKMIFREKDLHSSRFNAKALFNKYMELVKSTDPNAPPQDDVALGAPPDNPRCLHMTFESGNTVVVRKPKTGQPCPSKGWPDDSNVGLYDGDTDNGGGTDDDNDDYPDDEEDVYDNTDNGGDQSDEDADDDTDEETVEVTEDEIEETLKNIVKKTAFKFDKIEVVE